MKAIKKILLISFSIINLFACTTSPHSTSQKGVDLSELDKLILDMGEKIIPLLPSEKDANIAVYYFTVNGKESPYSDYLINNLTTEIANRAPENCHMVSRKGLDRIMDEYSFQLSDLVSEDTQVNIGELLGADTIITGYITPLGDRSNINVQLIDVHTGTVSGGFTLNFSGNLEMDNRQASDRITLEHQYSTQSGAATTTTIYENFDGPISEVSPGFFEEHWGEHIVSINGETDIDSNGFAYLNFSAQLDTDDYLAIQKDSDMTFYMDLPLNTAPEDSEGIYLKVKAEGFSSSFLMVRQIQENGQILMGVPISLNSGQWNELRIPYGSLKHFEGEDDIDFEKNISLTLGIPYFENVTQGYFKEKSVEGSVQVDELGLYKLKTPEIDNGMIASYEDEILTTVPSLHCEGALFFTDYSQKDEGIEKLNKGFDSSSMDWSIEDSGPVGRFLAIKGQYKLNEEINTFLDDKGEISLVLSLFFPTKPKDHKNLSFLISSNGLTNGYLYVTNPEEEETFETSIRTGKSWSRISVDFTDLIYSDEGTGGKGNDPMLLRTIWPISAEKLKEALKAEDQTLNITLNIDELSWE